MSIGIAIGLAVVSFVILQIVAFKWVLNQLLFLQALISGLNQDSDNQWEHIHLLETMPCPITGRHLPGLSNLKKEKS